MTDTDDPLLLKLREALHARAWRFVKVEPPPANVPLIGYDEFYHRVGECFWERGRFADDGSPSLVFVDSDDCRITHWQPMPGRP